MRWGHELKSNRGLEADQKVIAAHGCYASTVTTALTAQNTQGVHGIHHTPPHFVEQLLDAVLSDVDIDVVKTGKSEFESNKWTALTLKAGMLASDETIKVVAASLKKYGKSTVVIDPVSPLLHF